jgi:succinate-semialdehyde dehydrogenase/glutarate-semialdehyde dehydrogenase
MNLIREACYINGKWETAESGHFISVSNPADGSIFGRVPDCGEAETKRAITAAYQAWPAWRDLLAKDRADLLLKWSHLIAENKNELARIMTLEQGKPLTEALGEIDYANDFVRWYAEEARRIYGDVMPAHKKRFHLVTIKQSIGVVAAITPWNFPAAMITRKIAPALAAGCTVVVKPDSSTPFTALALAALAEQAGLPAGVFNMVTGKAEIIGKELTSNELVRKLSFTGSTQVGRLLMQQCSSSIKKISLELGGNAPFIIFADADLDAAIQGAMASKFRNSGQTCVCANRIYVQDEVYDAVVKKMTEAISQMKVGNGLEKGVQQGPLINQKAIEKVETHIADAVKKGARIVCGGKKHALGGLFFEPTLLTDVNDSMLLAKEETFGPVAPLFRFKDENEVIQMANDTIFGLASYFYTKDMARVWRVSEALEYGMVGINTGLLSTEVAPFGGIKQSGIGREGSRYGIEEYVEIKYLCMGE